MGNAFDSCTGDIDASQNPQNQIPENQKLLKRNHDQTKRKNSGDHLENDNCNKEEPKTDSKVEKIKSNQEIDLNQENNVQDKINDEKELNFAEDPEKNEKPQEVIQNQENNVQSEAKANTLNEEKSESKRGVTIGIQTSDDFPLPIRKKKKKRNPPNFTDKQSSPFISTTDMNEMPPNRPTEYVPQEIKNFIEKQSQEVKGKNQQQKGKKPVGKRRPTFNEDQIFDEQELVEQSRYSEMIMNYNQNNLSIVPMKLNFYDFTYFPERQKYKTIILGDENYTEEDFKLLHLSTDNQFFNSLGDLKNITNLQIKFASVYGASGLIQKLVQAINQLPQLVTLDLDFKPNIDLLNKLVECNESISMAKIKKTMIEFN